MALGLRIERAKCLLAGEKYFTVAAIAGEMAAAQD
jgi:hypothetical protein